MKTLLNEEIRTNTALLSKVEEGIIVCKIDDYVDFTREDIVEIREANKILSKGELYSVLFEVGKNVDLTKDAREASVEPEHYKNRIALALLHTNFAMKMIADFYIKIYQPPKLTKNFSSREKALIWLREKNRNYKF